jgi:2-oxoglutarate ferredoxin oxidoreductase subunit beta
VLKSSLKAIYKKPDSLTDIPFPYCSGCSHGLIHKLICEIFDEIKINDQSVGVTSAGCSVRNWRQFDCDMVMALHGRGPAVATGLKRALPNRIIFTYQGDGDCAAIGIGEIIHAALRCEKITVIYVNNGLFGATGGQQAPTTLVGQKTTSYPSGRDPDITGHPIRLAEMLAGISQNAFIARCSVHDTKNIINCKKMIKQAFLTQKMAEGFSFVEILSICPTNWKLSPSDCNQRIKTEVKKFYPINIFKEV